MVATPRISGIDNKYVGDFAFTTSHDASRGGTCFGDSGGPNFIGDSNVVGGVTSFGTTSTCKGHNGAYRVDQPDDLEWLRTSSASRRERELERSESTKGRLRAALLVQRV